METRLPRSLNTEQRPGQEREQRGGDQREGETSGGERIEGEKKGKGMKRRAFKGLARETQEGRRAVVRCDSEGRREPVKVAKQAAETRT